MTDTGTICSICLGLDHQASSCPKRSRFRNSAGKWVTRGLFRELHIHDYDGRFVLYTLYDKDRHGLPSLYLRYMEMEDLTEFEFANTYFDGWGHWQQVCNASWFQEYISRWRTELELKLKARAMRYMREEAELGTKNQYQANLFLINKGWIDKTAEPSRRGRPSKTEIQRIAAEEAFNNKQVEDDLKRLEIN